MRDGVVLVAFGCAPFAAGALVPADGDTGLICPFRELTGFPCPLCGATRAFALAARGDSGFVRFNAVWVVVAVLLIAAGVALLVGRRAAPGGRAVAAFAGVAVLAGWVDAWVQRAAIVG